MKRLRWFLIPLLPLLFASCERKTIAHAFLNVGFNGSLGQKPAPATTETARTNQPSPRVSQDVRTLEENVHRMRQLQGARTRPGDLGSEEMKTMIQQITALSESLVQSEVTSETERALLGEIKWLALTAGAEVFPEAYHAALASCQDQLFGTATTARQAGGDSAKRFIREYLVKQGSRDETLRALMLHSLAYPDCEMNVDLYITITEQLANRHQIPSAVSVAKQGLERCDHHADVKLLADQLERISVENQGAPGVPMNFSGPLIDGKRFDVTSTRGGPVLVVFWATWSSECQDELVILRQLCERYRNEGLQIVSVSLDNDRNLLTKFVEENKWNWPQIFTDQQPGMDNPIAKYYGVTSIPRTFLLDSDGVVVAADLQGDFETETAILNLLARKSGTLPK